MTTGEPLVGGMDPRYAPVRVGDTVRRAAGTERASVSDLLLHLEAVGFEGAPRYLGIDDEGREILSWIEGDVPLPPYPRWAMTDRALADLGAPVRRLHEATATFRTDHGDPAQADDLIDVLMEERAHSADTIRAEIAAGNPAWIRDWADAGGDERAAADDGWIARSRAALLRAIAG